jgi:hypothetical protein
MFMFDYSAHTWHYLLMKYILYVTNQELTISVMCLLELCRLTEDNLA